MPNATEAARRGFGGRIRRLWESHTILVPRQRIPRFSRVDVGCKYHQISALTPNLSPIRMGEGRRYSGVDLRMIKYDFYQASVGVSSGCPPLTALQVGG